MTNCRFYGKSHVALARAGLLIDQHGNECAAIEDSYAPCERELAGEPIDEKICPLARRRLRDWLMGTGGRDGGA